MAPIAASEEEKVNILLVDDQPARILSYRAILADLGQNLIAVHSGAAALQVLLGEECAVILLDVRMPDMDGFETAALIHEHPRHHRVPIIFVTGAADSELDRVKGYKLGAIDFVCLPLVPEVLRSKVAILVELYRARRELERSHRALMRVSASQQAESARQLEVMNRHLQLANDALRAADQQKDEFLAILAHELRNPLSTIRSAVDLLLRRPQPDAQATRYTALIDRQVAQLVRIVDDLLDVSRIKRGTLNLDFARHEVSSIVERAVEGVRHLIEKRRHTLEVDCPPVGLPVRADLTRLVQVVSNVLTNASKYMEPGGQIRLRALAVDRRVEIRVVDTGLGIAPDALPKLFTLFSRVHDTAASPSGLGIGLALSRQIIQLHGGDVRAHSEGLGRGSEFIIQLPVGPGAIGVTATPLESSLPAVQTHRILLADDNLDALQSLATLLELEGHELRTATSGAEALGIAAEWQPEIAFLDIGMPGMTGYEVASRLRSLPAAGRILLVALSGWGQPQDRQQALASGFDVHVAKPIGFDELARIIASYEAAGVRGVGARPSGA